MSVSNHIAERLITHAKGVAVDILFKHANIINQVPASAPSSDLLVSRWASLPAASAALVTRAITDTEVLDKIAAKEKRKTVRIELARNRHLHPVTRMYYLQEANRGMDHDLTRAALDGMSPAELLGYFTAKDPITRYYPMKDLARRLLELGETQVLQQYASDLDSDDFRSLCEYAVIHDAAVAFELFDRAGIAFPKMAISGQPRNMTYDIPLWRRLYEIDPKNVASYASRAFEDSPEFLAKIDENLVSALLGRHSYNLRTVKVLAEHDLLDVLIAENPRLHAETSDWLIEQAKDESTRTKLILRHNDPAKSVTHIEDHLRFATVAADVIELGAALSWLNNASYTLGLTRSLEVLGVLYGTSEGQSRTINKDLISMLANRCELTVDEVVAAINDELFVRIVSLPKLAAPHDVLTRSQRLGQGLDVVVSESILANNDEMAELQLHAADILTDLDRRATIIEWLRFASAETVKPYLLKHRHYVAELVANERELHRNPWTIELVHSLLPKGGWGVIRSDQLLGAAMGYLNTRIGENARVWEAALVLFETWTGSLDELVDTAERI
jgi:hypothetical protein